MSEPPVALLPVLHAQTRRQVGLRALPDSAWFEVETGIFGADGEGVGVFARPLSGGRFAVSDLGTLEHQRTHAQDLSLDEREAIIHLAEGHRCTFAQGEVTDITDPVDLWGTCLRVALVQIAAEGLIVGMRQGASAAQAESKR